MQDFQFSYLAAYLSELSESYSRSQSVEKHFDLVVCHFQRSVTTEKVTRISR